MYNYGLLLADFERNGEFVNDCIFTMMHHIGGDIQKITSLFQPVILKTFSKIYETEYMLCDVSMHCTYDANKLLLYSCFIYFITLESRFRVTALKGDRIHFVIHYINVKCLSYVGLV